MSGPQNKPKDAFDAFNGVDESVSKPILGSDGAASWQEFCKDNGVIFSKQKASSAPLAPLKKADKLGSGMKSWQEERAAEAQARKESGQAAAGDGHANFKKKDGQEEAMQRKERKRIEQRKRPETAKCFLAAKQFEGWKWDCVFTTKTKNGLGCHWDGSGSVKRLNGLWPAMAGPDDLPHHGTAKTAVEKETDDDGNNNNNKRDQDGEVEESSGLTKKMKKRIKIAPVIVEDPNHPMEQVQAAIRRRNERLGLGSACLLYTSPSPRD